jgi:hypothetical protein
MIEVEESTGMKLSPVNFIDDKIVVIFKQPLSFGKRPSCPDGFQWRDKEYQIVASLKEWVDFKRRGRQARNMGQQHAAVAENRGSWGVGRYHFQVRVTDGRLFYIYYDRAPRDVENRMGEWFLVSELSEDSRNR